MWGLGIRRDFPQYIENPRHWVRTTAWSVFLTSWFCDFSQMSQLFMYTEAWIWREAKVQNWGQLVRQNGSRMSLTGEKVEPPPLIPVPEVWGVVQQGSVQSSSWRVVRPPPLFSAGSYQILVVRCRCFEPPHPSRPPMERRGGALTAGVRFSLVDSLLRLLVWIWMDGEAWLRHYSALKAASGLRSKV